MLYRTPGSLLGPLTGSAWEFARLPNYGAVRGSAHHITFLRWIARSTACTTAYFRRGFRSTRCRPRGSAGFLYHGVTPKPRVVTGYHRQDLSCLSTSHVQVTIIRRQCAAHGRARLGVEKHQLVRAAFLRLPRRLPTRWQPHPRRPASSHRTLKWWWPIGRQ